MKQVLAPALCLAASLASVHTASAQSDISAPAVTLDTPRPGSYTQAQLSGALVSGRARDNVSGSGIAGIAIILARQSNGATRFYDGRGFNLLSGRYLPATLSGTGDLKAWSFRLPTVAAGLVPGLYRVQVLARDRKGNNGFAAPASFVVRPTSPAPVGDRVAPRVSFEIPEPNGIYSATETRFGAIGDVADNAGGGGVATVHIIAYRYADANGPAGYFNGQTFSSATPIENRTLTPTTVGDQPTQWLFDPFVFPSGRILLRAIARDMAGNTSQATLTFTRR